MRALAIPEPRSTRFVELPEPAPAAGEVLLRVRRVGYCGTDLSTYRGTNPLAGYPRVPGHEIGAEIAALGQDVPDPWRVGQAVTVVPYHECGRCTACRQGRINCCRHNETLGVQRDGALQPWFCVPHGKLIAAPGLGFAALALVEPLAVAAHACARGRIAAGDTVAVFGCGMIGLGVVWGAARRGARVIGIDLDSAKLEVARAAGAAELLVAGEETLDGLRGLTDGDGVDVAVEAVGAPATYQACLEAASFAGRVVAIGYAKAPLPLETRFIVQRELDVLGSRNAFAADLQAAADGLAAGGFPLERVITTVATLAEAGAALAAWDAAPADHLKIQIAMDEPS